MAEKGLTRIIEKLSESSKVTDRLIHLGVYGGIGGLILSFGGINMRDYLPKIWDYICYSGLTITGLSGSILFFDAYLIDCFVKKRLKGGN